MSAEYVFDRLFVKEFSFVIIMQVTMATPRGAAAHPQ